MGRDADIAWTDHTWNPWWGCTKLPKRRECDNCYADAFSRRLRKPCFGDVPRRPASRAVWAQPYDWDKSAARAGRIDNVFCMSMGDLFEDVSQVAPFRELAWKVMRDTTHLRWLLLTKRPRSVCAMMPTDLYHCDRIKLGVTVGTRKAAARRPPIRVDFISVEPLLEMIDLTHWYVHGQRPAIIIGAESLGALPGRDCPTDAVCHLVNMAQKCGARVCIKQLHIDGKLVKDVSKFPDGLQIRQPLFGERLDEGRMTDDE